MALLVLVNAMIPWPGETGGAWWNATGQARAAMAFAAAQGRASTGDFDPIETFFHDVPSDVVDAALKAGDPGQSATPFTEPFPLDRWPTVPTRVIASRDDRLLPATFQRRIAIERLGITPDEVPGGPPRCPRATCPLADRLEAYALEVVGWGARRGPVAPRGERRLHPAMSFGTYMVVVEYDQR